MKSCGGVEAVPNGDVSYPTGNDFGDKAIITCKKGLVFEALLMVCV